MNAKRALISTAEASFQALFSIPVISPSLLRRNMADSIKVPLGIGIEVELTIGHWGFKHTKVETHCHDLLQ